MTSLPPALAIFGSISIVLVLYTRRARKQAAALVTCYQGSMSWLTDAVRFRHRGADFTLRRLAGGGGLGGTGYFCSLVLDVGTGRHTVIAPAGAVKYVYAFRIPREHSWTVAAGARTLVTGPAHDAIARTLSHPGLATLMRRIFPRDYSTVTVKPEVRVAIGRLPYRQWVIEITGMPADVYERPEVLRPVLDDALALRDLIERQ